LNVGALQGPPSEALLDWCRHHQVHLVVGGKDPISSDDFYNTAFVIGPAGEVVFRQAKSVPIQFFQDGRPAPGQSVWPSPWGRLGLAVCYDLSYRRIMDRLVRLGAQGLVVPAVDDVSWGRYQHGLHARIARVRAAEYGLPVFRVASSGISQFIEAGGREVATAPYPGQGEILAACLPLPARARIPLDRWLAPWSCALIAPLIGFLSWNGLTPLPTRKVRRRSPVATGCPAGAQGSSPGRS
jgi:apolipoprotein N-acyltransferase